MIIRTTPDGIVVMEALLHELIATELFEAPGSYLSFRDVRSTRETISGWFTIHALNGDVVYRLTGWAHWLSNVACAELESHEPMHKERFTEAAAPPPR